MLFLAVNGVANGHEELALDIRQTRCKPSIELHIIELRCNRRGFAGGRGLGQQVFLRPKRVFGQFLFAQLSRPMSCILWTSQH